MAEAPACWAQSSTGQQPSAAALDAARSACAADLQQFCPGVRAGGGRLIACLKEHREQVSPGCKQAVVSALQGSGAAAAVPAAGTEPPAPAPRSAAEPALEGAKAAAPATAPMARLPTGAAAGAVRYFQLKRLRATMKDGDQERTVYTLLAPETWTLSGGFGIDKGAGSCFTDLYQVNGAVHIGDSGYGMAVVPRASFRYADDPAVIRQMEQRDQFDAKYNLKDCPIKAPMHAADFLRENLVWKFHKDRPEVTVQPFPELEQLVRGQLGLGPKDGTGGGAGGIRTEAARVRVSTTDDKGAPVEEWWSGVIVLRPIALAGQGMAYEWHTEQVTAFVAPKGQLDGYEKLYRVMATSIRLDPQFQAWRGQMVGTLYAKRADEVQKQNKIIADFQRHVVETLNGVTANAQQGAANAAYGADQLARGVQTFRDPSSGRTVELSNLYDHAWSNGNDRYIVTDDPNFNPNGHVSGDWGELQLVRPQP